MTKLPMTCANRTLAPVVVLALLGFLVPSPALAAGGGLTSLISDIAFCLGLAGVLSVVFVRLKIPTIAAFIVAGLIAGPLGLGRITDPANIEAIAELGLILLLFTIGLEMDLHELRKGGRIILAVGLLQFPLTVLFGAGVATLLSSTGIFGSLLDGWLAPLYIGAAIAGSSTLLVVKLFQDTFEIDTVPGRVSIGILVFQDLWAIVLIICNRASMRRSSCPSSAHSQASRCLQSPPPPSDARSEAGLRLDREVAGNHRARGHRLLLHHRAVGQRARCYPARFRTHRLSHDRGCRHERPHRRCRDRKSALCARDHGQGVGAEGLLRHALLREPRDFHSAPDTWNIPLLALVIAALASISRLVIFFPLLYFSGLDRRNATVTSVRLAQISEFGLVVVVLGLELGQLTHDQASAIILAFVLTALATSPLYRLAYVIHERLSPLLDRLGFKEPEASRQHEEEPRASSMLGFHRVASALLTELSRDDPIS